MIQNPTQYGNTMFHPVIDMDEKNISLASHPRSIFEAWMWDVIKHINQNHSELQEAKPPQPIKQWFHLMVRHKKTIIRLVSTHAFKGEFFPTWLLELVTQPTVVVGLLIVCLTKPLGRVTQPTTFVGFQSVCTTGASTTSNSTHQGFPECFSNQGFQE